MIVLGDDQVGHSRARVGRDGKPRYIAYYDDLGGGRRRSAGTFTSRREADKAWRAAEVKAAEGRVGHLSRSRVRFGEYVRDLWLPNHVIELSTRQNYTYQLERHIMPTFADLPMIEILPTHVREWVTTLRSHGVNPPSIRYCMNVLSAIFTTAFNDQITALHPCMGVKTPPIARRPRRIITPEQFSAIYDALLNAETRLLVETDIETGLRWGELTELRAKDVDLARSALLVSRVVIEVPRRFTNDGQRFVVKDYPKDKEWREVALSDHIASRLAEHIGRMRPDDLLFRAPMPKRQSRHTPLPAGDLGLTAPNDAGRTYRHGTLSGYSLGGCRCDYCRGAYADYRAKRRAAGSDDPRPPRPFSTDGHIPRSWFRGSVWKPALARAGIGSDVNIAAHLLLDVLSGTVDSAVIISNDSDLRLPVQLVRDRVPVGMVNPRGGLIAGDLAGSRGDGVGNHWWRRLAGSDFLANQLSDSVGGFTKPAGWWRRSRQAQGESGYSGRPAGLRRATMAA